MTVETRKIGLINQLLQAQVNSLLDTLAKALDENEKLATENADLKSKVPKLVHETKP